MNSELLRQAYYDPASYSAFSGIQRLQSVTKLPKKTVESWLKEQLTYTLHHRKRRNYKRQRYQVDNISEQWQTDLIDLRSLATENDDFNYIVVVIDVFSKYAWTAPIKRKSSDEIITVFKNILSESNTKPEVLVSDRGREYVNIKFQNYLKRQDIKYFSATDGETKACIAERFIRTIKELIFRYLTAHNTLRYVDVLEQLTESYNNRYHTSIGMSPSSVNPRNVLQVWKNLNKNISVKKTAKFKEGEYVRISRPGHVFTKGYLPNFSDEIFIINKVLNHQSVTVYKLVDLMNEEIEGCFYEEELQSIIKTDETVYRIEKILKTRKRRGKTEVLVQWKGWPEKFNSWIPHEYINNKPTQ